MLHLVRYILNFKSKAIDFSEYAIIEGDIAIDVSEYNWLHKQEKSPDDSKQQESAMRDLIDGEFIPVFPTVYKKVRITQQIPQYT